MNNPLLLTTKKLEKLQKITFFQPLFHTLHQALSDLILKPLKNTSAFP